MKTFRSFLLAGFLLATIAPVLLTACSKGQEPGDVNVEDASAKDVHEEPNVGEKQGEGVHDNKRGADR